ncbi:hypothetical protein EST38_g7494 [Candolleomyces aberdarensis]|uniref:Uncharacterized protein n=1 Tax=Candolleomyces aberdarensis TaxID=2316362 RepID=A0A4Q2DH76_9AGAR|nr:hypothetical protein EST38_g7494 [Candolleomyces aberdarensis]
MDTAIDYEVVYRVLARAGYANFSLKLVAAGISIFMAIYGLSVFFETPKELRKGRGRYILISMALTVLLCLTASLEMAWYFQNLFGATSGIGFAQIASKNASTWVRILSSGTSSLLILIGDALLVFRCYAIWSHHRWVAVPPALTCLTSFAIALYILYIDITHKGRDTAYESARTFLTASTNVMVTALISGYLIHARRNLSQLLPSSDMRLYTGVVSILIESALPLSIFGIIYASIGVVPELPEPTSAASSFTVAYYTFGSLFYCFSVLSPQMIIFRVTTGRSWLRFPQATDGEAVSNPINFAHHRTAESSFVESPTNRGGSERKHPGDSDEEKV